MSPSRVTMALALGAVLLAPLAVGATPPAAGGLPVRVEARSPVVQETLAAAHETFLLRPVFDSPPALELLLAFSQPVLRGQDDTVSVVWVRPHAGSWSGLWAADSAAGGTSPRKVTIGPEGMFLVVGGGSLATGDRVTVTYTFVGEDLHAWTFAAPTVPVLDDVRQRTVALAGASASDHGHDDLPEAVVLSLWNLLPRDAHVGFTILDAAGDALFDATVGDCLNGEGNLTQTGCRALYLLERGGTTLVTWHARADGTRVEHERHTLADLAEAPHVFGAKRLARAAPMPIADARVLLQ